MGIAHNTSHESMRRHIFESVATCLKSGDFVIQGDIPTQIYRDAHGFFVTHPFSNIGPTNVLSHSIKIDSRCERRTGPPNKTGVFATSEIIRNEVIIVEPTVYSTCRSLGARADVSFVFPMIISLLKNQTAGSSVPFMHLLNTDRAAVLNAPNAKILRDVLPPSRITEAMELFKKLSANCFQCPGNSRTPALSLLSSGIAVKHDESPNVCVMHLPTTMNHVSVYFSLDAKGRRNIHPGWWSRQTDRSTPVSVCLIQANRDISECEELVINKRF